MNNIYKQFNEAGFYIAKNLLDQKSICKTNESVKQHFDNQLMLLGSKLPKDIFDSMKLLHHLDIERYKKTVGSLWRKMSIYNLLHHANIQQFVDENFGIKDIVISGGQVLHVQSESLRIPGGYFGLPAHQDFPSVNGSLDGFVVWVALQNVDKDRYPMEIIPYSHTKGIFPTFKNEHSVMEISHDCYVESDFKPVLCDVGDVVFMSNFLVHRSSQQGDGGLKLACSTRYCNADEPSFINRCYPSAYIRTVDREQYKQS